MRKIENWIAKCVYKGIELYMSKHRFGFNGHLEMLPMTHAEFEKHLHQVLADDAAESYLEETTPTTHPHFAQ